jgi:8-oxo-dGTP diphosphatase
MVLACRRGPGKDAAGLWEFPGGKVEPGEAPAAALVREVHEELGVGIHVGALVDRSVTVRADGRAIDLACYDCTLTEAAPIASTDHDELRWLPPGRLGGLEWAEADLPAVRLLTGTEEEDA